jgi:catechol 2,3-dioxygenase-like lactoylglutathione lyase family enzyme
MFRVEQIDHVALTVRDVEGSASWYERVLGLERRFEEAWGGTPLMVCAGSTCLALFPATTDNPLPRPEHDTIAMRHVAFRVSREGFQQAQERFRELGLPFSFEDHTVSHSVYIADPDGHRLEVTTYEV